ncbi:NUDIX hydrolase [Pilimelia columellifera]|uniref:NUDIX hydrolase n=1 Tax=Pilimelia columellifera subsp. columellifera TaxID=706583 RepID=A0ABP6AGK1_9ACTN
MTIRPPAARPHASSGAVFFDERGHLLLVDPVYKPYWNLVGGAIDAGETPRSACAREVHEELGVRFPIGDLLVSAWLTFPDRQHFYFVFDGATLTSADIDAIRLDPAELGAKRFVTADAARVLVPPWLVPVIDAVLDARSTGGQRYLELDGR